MHYHKVSKQDITRWQDTLLSTTRKQYNHVFNNLEITIQVRLLEYLEWTPREEKKKRKKKRKRPFLSDDCINYLWHWMPLQESKTRENSELDGKASCKIYFFSLLKQINLSVRSYSLLVHNYQAKIQDKKHRGPATLLFCTMQSAGYSFWKFLMSL